jgi:hypothetical protein
MVGIGIELALELGQRCDLGRFVGGVRISLIADEAVDSRVCRAESPQHVVERAVLHHEYDHVLEIVQSR